MKILEIRMKSGTFDDLNNTKNFEIILQNMKNEYPDVIIQIEDLSGIIKKF